MKLSSRIRFLKGAGYQPKKILSEIEDQIKEMEEKIKLQTNIEYGEKIRNENENKEVQEGLDFYESMKPVWFGNEKHPLIGINESAPTFNGNESSDPTKETLNELRNPYEAFVPFITKPSEFSEDMLEAVKVIFLEGIHEDDFVSRGMKAWLVGVDALQCEGCWELHFDFTDFEEENQKYFRQKYYDSDNNPTLTAHDLNMYKSKYSTLFGDFNTKQYGTFNEQLSKHIKFI